MTDNKNDDHNPVYPIGYNVDSNNQDENRNPVYLVKHNVYTEEQLDAALMDMAKCTFRWMSVAALTGLTVGEITMWVFLWAIDRLK